MVYFVSKTIGNSPPCHMRGYFSSRVLLAFAVVLPNKGTENSTTCVLGILAVPLPLISGHKGTQTILTERPKHFTVPFFGGFQLVPRRIGKHRRATATQESSHRSRGCISRDFRHFPATTPKNTVAHGSRDTLSAIFGIFLPRLQRIPTHTGVVAAFPATFGISLPRLQGIPTHTGVVTTEGVRKRKMCRKWREAEGVRKRKMCLRNKKQAVFLFLRQENDEKTPKHSHRSNELGYFLFLRHKPPNRRKEHRTRHPGKGTPPERRTRRPEKDPPPGKGNAEISP